MQHEKLNVIRDESRIAGFLETLLHQSLTNTRFANSKRHLHNPATELLCQSIVQGTLLGFNEQALHAVLKVCEQLEIDGQAAMQWCKRFDVAKQGATGRHEKPVSEGKPLGAPSPSSLPSNTAQAKAGRLADTHVLNIQYMRLPKYINSLVRADPPAFLYAYHNGQQTFASNDAWYGPFLFLPLRPASAPCRTHTHVLAWDAHAWARVSHPRPAPPDAALPSLPRLRHAITGSSLWCRWRM